jgi:hypothetical protein
MDLASLKPSERIIDILHPVSGDKIGVTVQILSLSDERMMNVKRRIRNKNIELQKRGKTLKASDIEDNELDLLVACITGWNWGENKFKDKTPDCNEKNVKEVLTELPWFKQQITEAIDDEKAFFQS